MRDTDIILTKDLHHVYPGGIVALRGVNVEIKENSITAIIGQNGSGKTTLVKHFNGLLKPTKGEVYVKGTEVTKWTWKNLIKCVGYVFQNPSHQIFCKTVQEEIEFGLKNLGYEKSEIKRRVEEVMEKFGLKQFKYESPFNLSFPLKKLVSIASIYAMDPEVLILDEPTTGQDYFGVSLIKDLVLELKKEGRTIIVVSHDMEFVAETADEVIVIHQGLVKGKGTPKQIFTNIPLLKETKLMSPQITRLAQMFKSELIPKDVLTVSQMYTVIREILSTRQ